MLKKEGEKQPALQENQPEEFMGMVISKKPFLSNTGDGGMITVFDVNIEEDQELIKGRVELRGRRLNEIDNRIRRGKEVIILGNASYQDRRPDRYGVIHNFIIDAQELEFPPVKNPGR